jgi:hypothetical protein
VVAVAVTTLITAVIKLAVQVVQVGAVLEALLVRMGGQFSLLLAGQILAVAGAVVETHKMVLLRRRGDLVLLLFVIQTLTMPLLQQALLQSQYLVGIVFTNLLHPAQLHSKITP